MAKQDGMSAGLRVLFDRNGSHVAVRVYSSLLFAVRRYGRLIFVLLRPVPAHPRIHRPYPHTRSAHRVLGVGVRIHPSILLYLLTRLF
jgi:hypothetical protein